MKRILLLLFLLPFLSQCVDSSKNQTPNEKTAPVVLADTTNHSWVCSTIETYPPGSDVQKAMGAKGRFWPVGTVLRIAFMDGTAAQIAKVKSEAVEWLQYANLGFTWVNKTDPSDVRISFNANNGAWSYVGLDNQNVSKTSVTMNLGWQDPQVIKHEFGHLLGLLHEHQNPSGGICFNEPVVIQDLSGPPNYWTTPQIRFNVLDKADPSTVLTSPWDKTSIMHYNIVARWTCNNTAIPGGMTISQADKDFIAVRYPGKIVPPNPSVTLTASQIDDLVKMLDARVSEIDTTAARTRRSNATIKKMVGR